MQVGGIPGTQLVAHSKPRGAGSCGAIAKPDKSAEKYNLSCPKQELRKEEEAPYLPNT